MNVSLYYGFGDTKWSEATVIRSLNNADSHWNFWVEVVKNVREEMVRKCEGLRKKENSIVA